MGRSIHLIIMAATVLACKGPKQTKEMEKNPMMCNPATGICEATTDHAAGIASPGKSLEKPVKLVYFTDPICSSCWGIEPQLRKLKLEYGHVIDIEYRMGGLLPDWSYNSGGISKPSDVAVHWDEVSAYYEMPIDGDVWLEDPLPSSYPPSIAFKAAQLQDKEKAVRFLRRIREMVFLEKKNITRWEHISRAAEETGLDTGLLKSDCEGRALNAFRADLEYSRKMGVRGFPTFFFSDTLNHNITIYGYKPYEDFENTVKKLLPQAQTSRFKTDIFSLLDVYPTLTAREYSEIAGLPKNKAESELNKLSNDGLLRKTETKNGNLWKK